jgi:HPt (histidine-containing phosphotransfer) domain-containing protein
MQEQLRALVVRHHANLLEQIAVISRLLDEQDEHGDACPRVEEAQGISHQLKGTAGSMGFPDVGAAACALDDSLKALKRESDAAARLRTSLDLLDTLRRVADATTPEMSTLYNADLAQLKR